MFLLLKPPLFQTLDVTDHLSLLKLINFKDQYLLMPPKVLVLEALAETMATLGPFAPLKTKVTCSPDDWGNLHETLSLIL